MRSARYVATFVLCLIVTSSCITQMTGIAPSSTPITSEDTYTIIGPTKGHAGGVMAYIIPMFEDNPSQKARDRAIRRAGADALIEVTEDHTVLYLYFIMVCRTRVEGTAVKVQRGGAKR